MRTDSDNHKGQKGRRLSDLRSKTAELERELDDVRMLLKCELARGYDVIRWNLFVEKPWAGAPKTKS